MKKSFWIATDVITELLPWKKKDLVFALEELRHCVNSQLTFICSNSTLGAPEQYAKIYSKLTIKAPERCH